MGGLLLGGLWLPLWEHEWISTPIVRSATGYNGHPGSDVPAHLRSVHRCSVDGGRGRNRGAASVQRAPRLTEGSRMTTTLTRVRRRVHPAWVVAGVAFVALLGAAGFRAAPGVLMVPLQDEFGWSRGTLSLAVGVNLVLFGLTAPFAAALMDRFGIRRVTTCALVLVAVGSGATVFMTASWQLVLLWGAFIALGTGSMALVFAATIAQRWFVARRGLVTGVLTAGSATGQLVFLPLTAWLAETAGW